jgi:hypothetical protein
MMDDMKVAGMAEANMRLWIPDERLGEAAGAVRAPFTALDGELKIADQAEGAQPLFDELKVLGAVYSGENCYKARMSEFLWS